MQDCELVEALQVATRDFLAVALRSLDQVPGLKLQHVRLLIAVDEHPGVASATLAEILGISPSAVTRQADRLCDEGYLKRTQRPGNRRIVELGLTPEGKEVVGKVLEFRAAVFLAAIPAVESALLPALSEGLDQLHGALVQGSRPEAS